MSFFDSISETIQSSAEDVFSNFTQIATNEAMSYAPSWVQIGNEGSGNLTSDQVAAGQRGVNTSVPPITQRDGVDSETLKNGFGINFQSTLMKLGPIGIIGIAVIGALLLRKRK